MKSLDELCVNTIRFLAADAVEKAQSGHPGMPMGTAPLGFVVWDRLMRYNPKNPDWLNRDRFVLSAGHGSLLQYSLLYLTGYDDISLDEIKNFRQEGSRTPGHPENRITRGVEVTTGPLGQGLANGVGLAMAEAHLAARFNKPEFPVIDHYTYIVMGDGCQMEGISGEASSLAGHLGLGKLIVLYDDNHVSIDGSTDLAFTEDVGKRFEAYGWHVQEVLHGDDDLASIQAALEKAKSVTDKPSLIKVTTTIGCGAPHKGGTSAVHGAALGAQELQEARENLKWPYAAFEVPEEVLSHFRRAVERGAAYEEEWNHLLTRYQKQYPAEAALLKRFVGGELPLSWEKALEVYSGKDKNDATRNHSGELLNALGDVFPELLGGSADLAPSNKSLLKTSGDFRREAYENRNIRFGVREHAMGAICNGLALHGSGLLPYGATFLVFTDYMRAALRLSAISHAGVIWVLTHDSVAVGEDGPTHQPIEHLASLRAIPGLTVIRPADGRETAGAYKAAVEKAKPAQGLPSPTLLALSRQGLPALEGTSFEETARGAYILSDSEGTPDIILIGTGSEVHLCTQAAAQLRKKGMAVRVVSLPSWELFEAQDEKYRESVLPQGVTKRLAVEAGSSFGWCRYVGPQGAVISIDTFGESAPGDVVLVKKGYTVENVIAKATSLLG